MNAITFPVLDVKMVDASKVIANDYNPNKVASMELDLLEHSITEDGVTQPIVVYHDPNLKKYIIIDGFHRHLVLTQRLKCKKIPIVEIKKELRERMASTIRHNRARGKHQVDLQAELVKSLVKLEWTDEQIATHLGMTEEELLRLKQIVGIAKLFSNKEYSKSWGEQES